MLPVSKDALKIHESGSATASAHDLSSIGRIRRDGEQPHVLRGRYWSLRRRSYERQLFPPTYHVFILELGSPWVLVSAQGHIPSQMDL